MKSKGYTLWLVPKEPVYSRFSKLITNLAKKYGGPLFEPHVTLLGELTLSEKRLIFLIEKLVEKQKPFTITLNKIAYEDYYFRTLIVKALKTRPLLALHQKAKKIFEVKNTSPYMPHLSLLYGIYPLELKKEIIARIGKNQPAKFKVHSLVLLKGGKVEDWKIVKEFPF